MVFVGGAIGSTSRWFTGELVPNDLLVVLMVNVVGTALAGWVGYRNETSQQARLFWITGFAGGFTTFSSLSYFIAELPLVEASFLAALTLILSLSLLAAMQRNQP